MDRAPAIDSIPIALSHGIENVVIAIIVEQPFYLNDSLVEFILEGVNQKQFLDRELCE
jgi:hypothetical protein